MQAHSGSIITAVLLICFYLFGFGISQNQSDAPLTAEDFTPICDPDDFRPSSLEPSLPNLPDQFYVITELNLINSNGTAAFTVYYDGVGDRGRLEYVLNHTSVFGIIDYTLGEIFYQAGDDCSVSPIADGPLILKETFGVTSTYQNGSVHIRSHNQFFEQDRDDSVTRYVGEDTVRGIPTRHWQACFSRENLSSLIDYYFVHSSTWNYVAVGREQNLDMIPVQLVYNITQLLNGEILNTHALYSFVDFRTGPDSVPDSVFQVPSGQACKGHSPDQTITPPTAATSNSTSTSGDVTNHTCENVPNTNCGNITCENIPNITCGNTTCENIPNITCQNVTTCGNVTNITTRLGLSNGGVAGVAIALFVVGVALGMIVQLVCGVIIRWCRHNRTSVSYGRQYKYRHSPGDDVALS